LNGGSFDVLIDGNKVDTITVGATGGWQTWTTVNGNSAYAIGAGTHTLEVLVDATAYNLNWIDFTSTTASTTALPGQVQASDYTALTGTLKLEACSDVGGGEDLGYTSVGATAQYRVSVATAGSFNAAYRVAALNGGSFDVLIDGNKVDTITVGATGGWQTWTTVNGNSAYSIGAGTHTLEVLVDATAYNLNWIDLTTAGSCGSAGGSYAETCSSCSVSGTTLTCDCLSEAQASVATSINLCACTQPPVISNANGVLSCP
jgi:glucan 1,3-beta-glucosidase